VDVRVKDGELLEVPSRTGQILRTYPASITDVSVSTGGAPESDLDLEIHECMLDGAECKLAASSGSPTDVELARFTPKVDRAYKFIVDGYKVPAGEAAFQMIETIGVLNASQLGSDRYWNVVYSMDKNDPFFQSEIFRKDPFYEARGRILVASNDLTLAIIPVQVRLRSISQHRR
jgi:hypothetical protein